MESASLRVWSGLDDVVCHSGRCGVARLETCHIQGREDTPAAFAVQLVLNVAWSLVFFHFHQHGWAFAEIVVLWLAIGHGTSNVHQGRRVCDVTG